MGVFGNHVILPSTYKGKVQLNQIILPKKSYKSHFKILFPLKFKLYFPSEGQLQLGNSPSKEQKIMLPLYFMIGNWHKNTANKN